MQRSVLEWLALTLPPGSKVHHVANESAVDPNWSSERKARYFAARKADGVLDGFPDLAILLPGGRTVWVEMKRPRFGTPSSEQLNLHREMREIGHAVEIASTIEGVEAFLRGEGVPLRKVHL
ncbi:PDDEXK family nuclease [Roseomonas populi]|uniref:VRR-NUC domain-containing protein n=1 Tax=Roseomonas populi TaxID=3121582 RepID=A0ABT1X130_9PROT|nr:hypothetical protein [Roseomonas pecuniae]MCR0981807.1 hypothetical protein [Roseomonas pecuniae]